MTNPNPNRIPNRVNSLWKNKPKNMAPAGTRTRVSSLAKTQRYPFAKFIFCEYSRTPEA